MGCVSAAGTGTPSSSSTVLARSTSSTSAAVLRSGVVARKDVRVWVGSHARQRVRRVGSALVRTRISIYGRTHVGQVHERVFRVPLPSPAVTSRQLHAREGALRLLVLIDSLVGDWGGASPRTLARGTWPQRLVLTRESVPAAQTSHLPAPLGG